MKLLIFGAGANGKACQAYIMRKGRDELIGFLDNAAGKTAIEAVGQEDVPVYRPEEALMLEFDFIWISNGNPHQVAEIRKQLDDLHIPQSKIRVLLEDQALLIEVLSQYNQYDEQTNSRVTWLRNFAEYAHAQSFPGNVAECGVCMGEFSYFINKYFSNKQLYLFDTFEGFSERDLSVERTLNNEAFLNSIFNDQALFSAANEQVVMTRVLHPEKCVLKKGYFPDTAQGLEDTFCFVNLDMDLYQPMLEGLRFFYRKMCPGGVLLLHDYFHPELPGVKQAVEDFERELGTSLHKVPIGDFCSIAIIVP